MTRRLWPRTKPATTTRHSTRIARCAGSSWSTTTATTPLDHLCRVRGCVRPEHLEPVLHRTNVLRGEGRAAANAERTHCAKGHAYDEANTYVRPGSRKRDCRTCVSDAGRRYEASGKRPARTKKGIAV